ncbi:MAG: methionyl-tRNA formyltransferase [Candidatus Azotimanducaceae bacterium WSBS_2022_MAG_OTU7]
MKIVFAGTPEFAAGFLKSLVESDHDIVAVVTQPDKPGKRGKKLQASPVKLIAEQAKLTVLQPTRLTLTDIQHIDCDLMLVVAFGQILKPDVLAHPKLGCINVHASILPRWRGAAPIQRAILAGDKESGITLIQMDAGLDTGDMLAKAVVPISLADTTADLFYKFANIGQPLLLETLELVGRGTANQDPQDTDAATYAHKIQKAEAMIDWQQDAQQVDRVVRAFNPDPTAFSFLDTTRVKIHSGRVVKSALCKPGEILELSSKGLMVGCGNQAYLIEKIQLPIGKGAILSGADMLNGWTDTLKAGSTFGKKPDE